MQFAANFAVWMLLAAASHSVMPQGSQLPALLAQDPAPAQESPQPSGDQTQTSPPQNRPPLAEPAAPPAQPQASPPSSPQSATPSAGQNQPAAENSPAVAKTPAKKKSKKTRAKPAAREKRPEKTPDQVSTGKPAAPEKSAENPAPDKPGSPKKVIPDGSTSEPTIQLSTTANQQQATQQVQSTNQLLAITEENLRKASGRQLSADQQDMLKQIHTYMEQSKAATESGDLSGARNLALKAQLLSQEIIKD